MSTRQAEIPAWKEMAWKLQMLPAATLNSEHLAQTHLRRNGWREKDIEKHFGSALAWARSQQVVAKQAKAIVTRRQPKKLKADAALDLMFQACGADPSEIPQKDPRR